MALRNVASSVLSNLGLRSLTFSQTDLALKAAALRFYSSSVPDGLKYAKSHEWAKVDGDVATVGISDHAQSELGDVVYVELPEVGKEVKAGETFGAVESVKAASDVYSPVSGEVVEINQALVDKPAQVNSAPYGDGWFIKVKLSNKGELSGLMDSAAYKKSIEH
eukprot:CAMPEP_0202889892 /NCGR_PEP_ID=MMETSP1392-20130828/436_1 /ASSEMBLY_ACC=CAM_ASM_000868 /TAXON_ID=225041 /ORGANISM="Chlamydomonas chlamydogama, Strain SAG 11-48b" /LENGTH=163 /DNA_ID=CAMNT_0049573329 /DNA_START=53 /DNA_END=544 /DNA_ORIENTATION=+